VINEDFEVSHVLIGGVVWGVGRSKKVCISSFNVKSFFVATIFRYHRILTFHNSGKHICNDAPFTSNHCIDNDLCDEINSVSFVMVLNRRVSHTLRHYALHYRYATVLHGALLGSVLQYGTYCYLEHQPASKR
jgi:hypothetical protein